MLFRYRFINFEPNPFHDLRIPIGVIIENMDDEDAPNQVVKATKLPDAEYLGERAHVLLTWIHSRLENIGAFEMRRNPFGPTVRFGDTHYLPVGVPDPAKWVDEHVLNRKFEE